MKLDQVPQDDANMMQGKSRELCYATDEEGNYIPALSKGWEPKNIVFEQVWSEIDERINSVKELVKKGEFSPVYYFMEKALMDVKILSDYMNLPKRKIKKHFIPQVFKSLTDEILNKYAQVFNITLNQLKNFNE